MSDLSSLLEILEDVRDHPDIDILSNSDLIKVLIWRVRAQERATGSVSDRSENDA